MSTTSHTRPDADSIDRPDEPGTLTQRPKRRWSRRVTASTAAVALAVSLAVVNAPAAQAAGDCNLSSWTFPFCDISMPSIPRIDVSGRPDLTPKSSAWCRNTYIKASSSGYTYWALTQNTKYKLTLWPDYYSRYYQAMYWDGRAWQWLPVSRSYPHVIQGQRVYCDA